METSFYYSKLTPSEKLETAELRNFHSGKRTGYYKNKNRELAKTMKISNKLFNQVLSE